MGMLRYCQCRDYPCAFVSPSRGVTIGQLHRFIAVCVGDRKKYSNFHVIADRVVLAIVDVCCTIRSELLYSLGQGVRCSYQVFIGTEDLSLADLFDAVLRLNSKVEAPVYSSNI